MVPSGGASACSCLCLGRFPDAGHCWYLYTHVETDGGCCISISIGDARYKTGASPEKQAVMVKKLLGGLLRCLPWG